MQNLFDVLERHGSPLDPRRTVMARHKDRRYDVGEILRKGTFEHYQAYQSRDRFGKYDYLLSFIGEEGLRARLHGLYRIEGSRPSSSVPLPAGVPPEWPTDNGFYYDLRKLDTFDALEGRLVIEWRGGAINWAQRLRDCTVLDIGAEP